MLKTDVVVIGGGAAGATAALAAAKKGASVILIEKGPGASTLSSGAIDVCGSPLSAPGLPWSRFVVTRDNIHETIHRMPHHPYGVLSGNASDDATSGVMEMLETAISFFKTETESAGLVIKGDLTKRKPAPNMLGTWKLASFAQGCMQLGPLEGDAAVVSIRGLSAIDADSLAASLKVTYAATGMAGPSNIDGIEIDLDGRDTWTLEEAAEWAAAPGGLEEFIGKVSKAAGGRYRVALVPPILPMSALKHPLELEGGGVIRELLAMPPSAPGRRMNEALRKALVSRGVRVVRGAAKDFEKNGTALVSLSMEVDGAARRIVAQSWVLATGKFIGGGLVKEKAFRETTIGLPVFCGGHKLGEIFTKKLLREDVFGDHPAFAVGVMTDKRLRPVDEDGRVIYENLYAAGAALGGFNYHTGSCGLGVSILTGYRAGEEAAGGHIA